MLKSYARPSVTVMMPASNGAKYLPEAIESVLRQDFPFFEIILWDDGSTDPTYEVAKKYQKRDGRVRVYRSVRNEGVSKTRNCILKLARGEYLAPHDADDIMLNGRLRRQVALLDKRKDVGIVFGKALTIKGAPKSLGSRFEAKNHWLAKMKDPERSQVLKSFSLGIAHSSVMVRKSLVLRVGGYDERFRFGEDGDLFSRLWNKTKFYFLNTACYLYRVRADSLMGRQKLLREALAVLNTRKGGSNGRKQSENKF